jgi:hypothetical protein
VIALLTLNLSQLLLQHMKQQQQQQRQQQLIREVSAA